MAISIYDEDSFEFKFIPHFINRKNDKLDPWFAAFKRIDCIKTSSKNLNFFIVNLQMVGKVSVRIDDLFIDKHVLRKISELYKDKEVNFMLNRLQINNCDFDYISDEEAKFINKINPKMFTIERINLTFENIKTLFFTKLYENWWIYLLFHREFFPSLFHKNSNPTFWFSVWSKANL